VRIGIGLPATIAGIEGKALVEWARQAEAAGFSSLAVIDRLVYPNYEPLVALSAAAAVTERIRLVTSAILPPYRANAALLAKQLATLDHLSGGRLTVGAGLGARDDDFTASGMSPRGKGRELERHLNEWRRVWSGEEYGLAGAIGPAPLQLNGPPILLGGYVDATLDRVARLADGWISGGMPPAAFREMATKLQERWTAAGRDGEPLLFANAYFSLGEGGAEAAAAYIPDYYAFLGEEAAAGFASSVPTTDEAVRSFIEAYEAAGCQEIFLFPCRTDVDQVSLLASAARLTG
jgi:alkanesulfonate monooxygenase SsuD/methylene tetrahydromethanopterin reductase-like flavin-dependent oxidoreductase (luciferase family)